MKKIVFIILFTFLILLAGLLAFYSRYSLAYEQEKLSDYVSKSVDIFNDQLNVQKRYALSLSLMMSKNKILKDALGENNQTKALQEMGNILTDIKLSTGIDNIDIQMHTRDLRAFARNWDKSQYLGTPLGSFRKGLVKVKKLQSSFVSIELGKRLNIKAISPILDDKKNFLGSIEVIMDFQNIKARLEQLNMKMLALLEKEYIDIAVDLKKHKMLKDYYVVEKNYSQELFSLLNKNQEVLDNQKFFYEIDSKLITFIPMKSVGIEDVGVIALCIDANQKHNFSPAPTQSILFENQQYKFEQKYKRDVSIK